MSERLCLGEEHASVRHGVAFHEVEISVGVGFHVVVQTVGAQHLDEGHVLHLRLGQVGDVNTRRVALELHVESELVLLHVGGQVIDVLHHQVPVALRRIVRRVLQRLHEERLTDVCHIAGELTHLVGLSAVGVFVGDRQHLVGLQRHLQRDVSQCGVHRVFRRVQESCALQLLVVGATRQVGLLVEHGRGLVDVAGADVVVHHRLVFVVRTVRRHLHTRRAPTRIRDARALTQVGQGDDAARVAGIARLVGHPQLHAVDLHTRREVGQRLHSCVVFVAEELREEEVAVLLVVGSIDLEGRQLHTTSARNTLRCRLLLRGHQLQLQLAELQVGAESEEARRTLDKTGVGGERNVSAFHELHNLVFLSVVFQLQVLRVEVHRGLGVVVQVQVHLVAHSTVHAQVDLLVEVHRGRLAVANGQRGVLDVLHRGSELQLGGSLRLDAHATRTEYLLGRTEFEVHVGEVELLLALRLVDLVVLRTEELAQLLLRGVVHILLGRHHDGSRQPRVSNLVAYDVAVDGVVVLHLLLHVLRTRQVHRILPQVVVGDGGCSLDGPTRMEQRVGNGVFVVKNGLLDDRVLLLVGDTPSGVVALLVVTLLVRVSTLLGVRLLTLLTPRVVLEIRHRHSVASQTDDQQYKHDDVCP